MAQELLISNPLSPLRGLCDQTFRNNLKCPYVISYNPCLEGFEGWGSCNPQKHTFWTFYLRWTKWLSHNFDWMCLWEMMGVAWLPSNHYRIFKKGTSAFSLQSNEPFLKSCTTTPSLGLSTLDAFQWLSSSQAKTSEGSTLVMHPL